MFNTSLYKETLTGRQALRGYLAEFSGVSVEYLLQGNFTGFSTGHIEDVRGFSQLAGGLTQASLEYALTGQTILNLADFSINHAVPGTPRNTAGVLAYSCAC